MKIVLLIMLSLLPNSLFAANKPIQKYSTATIRVKEVNAIGKPQETDKTILLDSESGKAWLFVGGKNENDVRLVPICLDGAKTNVKGKANGRH